MVTCKVELTTLTKKRNLLKYKSFHQVSVTVCYKKKIIPIAVMTIKVNVKESLMGEELACSTEQNYKTCRPVVFKTLPRTSRGEHHMSLIYINRGQTF